MFDTLKPRLISIAALAAAATTALIVSDSQACGGFFCSQATPVNQSAEQIIFAKNDDGTVTAVVSIQYSGTAERFAWILPIAGVPDVAVSSNLAFQRLLTATTPQYSLTIRVEGQCKPYDYSNAAGGTTGAFPMFASGGAAGASSGPANAPVTVVAEGSAGPYDFVAISVAQDANDPARVALDWLAENNYDVSAFGEEILGEYLADGLNLLAFRLTKGNTTGSIRPVRVTYPAEYPAIPIRPTAVAANDDMGVMVYVVGEAQAIPKNYKSLVLNEALINWFNFSPTYNSVISRAADEADGQGFVSEFAGPSVGFNQTIFSQFDQQNWEQFQNLDFSLGVAQLADGGAPPMDGQAMFNAAAAQYGSWDGFREAAAAAVTLPSNVTLDAWLSTPWLYQDDPSIEIDTLKLLAGLQENVIDPMVETQRLLISQPYLTRMFTTMSPEDMTVDPLFSTNADLEDISNLHTAERVIECSPNVYQDAAPWRIELPQGGVIRGRGQNLTWPFDPVVSEMPANRKIVQLSEDGSGEVVTDNSQTIWQALNVAELVPNPGMGAGGSGSLPIGGVDEMIPQGSTAAASPSPSAEEDSSCALREPGKGSAYALALGLLASLAALQRRRMTRH